jgi:hypothetical protein
MQIYLSYSVFVHVIFILCFFYFSRLPLKENQRTNPYKMRCQMRCQYVAVVAFVVVMVWGDREGAGTGGRMAGGLGWRGYRVAMRGSWCRLDDCSQSRLVKYGLPKALEPKGRRRMSGRCGVGPSSRWDSTASFMLLLLGGEGSTTPVLDFNHLSCGIVKIPGIAGIFVLSKGCDGVVRRGGGLPDGIHEA